MRTNNKITAPARGVNPMFKEILPGCLFRYINGNDSNNIYMKTDRRGDVDNHGIAVYLRTGGEYIIADNREIEVVQSVVIENHLER